MKHEVVVRHETPKTRAECCCSWTSPWVTDRIYPGIDGRPMKRPSPEQRAVKAAQWHVKHPDGVAR